MPARVLGMSTRRELTFPWGCVFAWVCGSVLVHILPHAPSNIVACHAMRGSSVCVLLVHLACGVILLDGSMISNVVERLQVAPKSEEKLPDETRC